MKVLAVVTAHLRLFLLVVVSSLGLVACSGGGGGDASLTGVEITPANASKALGSSQQYAAMAVFSNNSKVDVSGQVSWSSSDPSVASISASGLAQTLKTGTTTISASYMGQSTGTSLTVTAAAVTAVAVTPSNASLAKGTSRAYTATATFTDRTTQDVTNDATWSSTTTAVATVGNAAGSKGRVTAVSVGSSTIAASFGGASGSTGVTVTAATLASIEVTPANPSVPKGTSRTLTATGVYTDGTTQNLTATATWTSASPAIATVGNTSADKGRVSGVAKGQAVISASASGVTGSTTVTVSDALLTAIQVTPASASRPKGAGQQYTATGTYSDSSTQDITATVVWSSSNTSVATISNATGSSGMASTLAVGTTTISAASGAITSSSATLTVTAAVLDRIEVTPSTPSIPVGTTQQFTATGVYTDGATQDFTTAATWASGNSGVLEVSNGSGSKGFSVANTKGTAVVSATHMGMTGNTTATVSDASLTAIQITPQNGKVAKNFDFPFTATGTFSDNTSRDVTSQVTWSVADPLVATISNADGSRGVATAGAAAGTTNVRATAPGGGVFGTASLQVTDATLNSVAVTPTNPSIPKGLSRQLTATGTFSDTTTQDLTRQASWTSVSPEFATVNSTDMPGLVQAVATGSSVVRASVSRPAGATAVFGETTVTVTAATLRSLVVTPDGATVPKGGKQQYRADGRYSDDSVSNVTSTVTWSSSNMGVATISNDGATKGEATGVALGTATLKAALDGVEDTASVTVSDARLTAIAVTPNAPSIAAGRTQQFTAMGTYTDTTPSNPPKDITTSVVWASDTPSVATISNATGSKGLATSTTKGSAAITAASGSVTSPAATLTVTDAVPVSIEVTPANATVAKGNSQQYVAKVVYSDNSRPDQTNDVTWSSSDTAKATVSNASGSKGLVSTLATGTTNIGASFRGASGMTGLTVSAATLQSITVTAMKTALPVGYRVKYIASGNYSDGSSATITNDVSWSTLNSDVATVSNTAGATKGEVTTKAIGSTSVIASLNGISGNRGITVNTITLRSIAVDPATYTIAPGGTKQFNATGTFSDDGTLMITDQVMWSSSNQAVVQIDAATGEATGGVPGSATISAAKGTVAGTAAVTNSPSTPAPPGP